MNALRVFLVCPSYQPQDVTCGVGDYTRCLAEELARAGDEVTVFTSSRYRGDPLGVSVRVVTGGERGVPDYRWAGDADVINVQYTPDFYRGSWRTVLPTICQRLSRRRIHSVITFHTLVDGSLQSKIAVPRLLLATDRAISANEEVTAMIRRRLPFLAGRLTEIPIGSNIDVVRSDGLDGRAVRAQLGVAADADLLVHFGLVYPGKGLETLFEAIGELRRQHRGRAHVVVVGDTRDEDREYRQRLEQLADRLDLRGCLTWTGRKPADDVAQILDSADLFVVPYDDGVSIRRGSLMAGLVHGCCVVSTTSGVPSAYLRDGENVSLVPPRDPRALARRLDELLGDPAAARRIGTAARRLAERFAWPVIARETREVYRSVIRR